MSTLRLRFLVLFVALFGAAHIPCLGQPEDPIVDLALLCDFVHPDEKRLAKNPPRSVLCAISDDSAPVPLDTWPWPPATHSESTLRLISFWWVTNPFAPREPTHASGAAATTTPSWPSLSPDKR